jgi:DNA polymerase III delta prime subunit
MVHFDEYFKEPELQNRELIEYVQQMDLENTIFYGPSGVGKYSLILKYIRKYSETNLKYNRKITITFDTKTYQFQMSDIHYEIDMAIFTYNSKLLWHEIYQQLTDIITLKGKRGIILCKNFHEINNEMLDNFYNYMQHPLITFLIMTEHVSFIPDNIIQSCNMVFVPRPPTENYRQICNLSQGSPGSQDASETSEINVANIINIKCPTMTAHHIPVCNQLIKYMEDVANFDYFTFRNNIYTLLVYNVDIYSSVWYIMNHFIESRQYPIEIVTNVTERVLRFLHLYNNNHHNIYHIERFLCYLQNVIINQPLLAETVADTPTTTA